jgi:uncharacterized protein (DUF1499 family)
MSVDQNFFRMMKQCICPVAIWLAVMPASVNADDAVTRKLATCQGTPNCISTQAFDKLHHIPPFRVSGDPQKAWQQFRQAVHGLDRALITHETETSLHVEITSLVLHFVDDVDAFLDAKSGVIHLRSASRVGHNNFGVHRKRIEEIRTKLRKLHVLA